MRTGVGRQTFSMKSYTIVIKIIFLVNYRKLKSTFSKDFDCIL
jgi:hypothetical protein